MSYYLYDVDGYVADGPSITGLEELRPVLESAGPTSREFVENGETLQLELLLEELSNIETPKNPSVAHSLKALIAAAAKASVILILTDGVGHERASRT